MPADVLKFQQDQNLSIATMSVLGPNSGGYFGEASLDTQYIFATGNGVPGWFIVGPLGQLIPIPTLPKALSLEPPPLSPWQPLPPASPPIPLCASCGAGPCSFR